MSSRMIWLSLNARLRHFAPKSSRDFPERFDIRGSDCFGNARQKEKVVEHLNSFHWQKYVLSTESVTT